MSIDYTVHILHGLLYRHEIHTYDKAILIISNFQNIQNDRKNVNILFISLFYMDISIIRFIKIIRIIEISKIIMKNSLQLIYFI